jgi:uncharacterized protein
VPPGDGGHASLQRAPRVYANFAEYVPLALILLALAEFTGAAAPFLHILRLTLLAGRLLHTYGVSQAAENYRFRVAGMALTLSTIVAAALLCVAGAWAAGP